jgi:hypothetical protein
VPNGGLRRAAERVGRCRGRPLRRDRTAFNAPAPGFGHHCRNLQPSFFKARSHPDGRLPLQPGICVQLPGQFGGHRRDGFRRRIGLRLHSLRSPAGCLGHHRPAPRRALDFISRGQRHLWRQRGGRPPNAPGHSSMETVRPQSNLPLETFFESLTTAIRYVRYTVGIKILFDLSANRRVPVSFVRGSSPAERVSDGSGSVLLEGIPVAKRATDHKGEGRGR